MTSELRHPVYVWRDACIAYGGLSIEGTDAEYKAAAVIEADREAVRAEQSRHAQAANMKRGACDDAPLVKLMARHRHQARAEVVGEIVAWLRDEQAATEQLRDEMDSETEGWRYADEHASAIEQSANAIEAKFGGRDAG